MKMYSKTINILYERNARNVNSGPTNGGLTYGVATLRMSLKQQCHGDGKLAELCCHLTNIIVLLITYTVHTGLYVFGKIMILKIKTLLC